MKRLLLALALTLFALPASAANRYVAASLAWNDATTVHANGTGAWNDDGCGQAADASVAPTSSDDVTLCPGFTVTVPCGVDPTLGTLVDGGTAPQWQASGGGLIADHSLCTPGDVAVWTFDNASLSTNTIVLDAMSANATFILKGRSIYGRADNTRLGIMDFSPGSCATNEPVCFLTYPSNAPYSAPTSIDTDLNPGTYTDFDSAPTSGFRMIRMVTGQHRGDVYFVQSTGSAPDRFRFTTGALNDMYCDGPKGSACNTTTDPVTYSLKAPRDIGAAAITWTNTNQWRLSATLPTGTIWGTATNYYGEGQCIVMDRGSLRPGTYYRVASSQDGGGSADTVVFDEFARLMPEDATAPAAWWAPCLRPGDQFIAYEPMALLPAVPGTDSVNIWVNGAQVLPDMEFLHFPRATPVDANAVEEEDSVIIFEDAGPVTIDGPISIIGLNNRASGPQTAPYVFGLYGTSNATIRGITGSGFYNPTITTSNNVWHGFTVEDSQGVVIDDWSMSWGNNECLWNTSNGDTEQTRPYEGLDIEIMNGNCHDLWVLGTEAGHSDSGRGIAALHTAGIPGTISVHDNLVWAVEYVGIATETDEALAGTQNSYVYNNVVGPIHPIKQVVTGTPTTIGIGTSRIGGGASSYGYAANNVLMKSVPISTVISIGHDQSARAYYSYTGENSTGLRTTNFTNGITSPEQYGLLFDLGGPGTLANQAIEVQRSQQNSTGHTLRDLVVRRGCRFTNTTAIYGIRETTTPGTTANWLDWQNLTLGMWCSEALANDEGIPNASSGAIRFQQSEYLSTSTFKNLLLINGDHNASDSDTDNTDFSIWGFVGNGGSTSAGTLENVVCSSNRLGASTGSNCQTSMNTTNVNLYQAGTYPGALGVLDGDLLTLRRESQFRALDDDTPIGARYAGIVGYTQTMADMGLDQRLLRYRATGDEEPDSSVLPSFLRSALREFFGGGGGGKVLPDHF